MLYRGPSPSHPQLPPHLCLLFIQPSGKRYRPSQNRDAISMRPPRRDWRTMPMRRHHWVSLHISALCLTSSWVFTAVMPVHASVRLSGEWIQLYQGRSTLISGRGWQGKPRPPALTLRTVSLGVDNGSSGSKHSTAGPWDRNSHLLGETGRMQGGEGAASAQAGTS